LGGEVFRGDCLFAEKLAYYGDRVGPLTLDKPLHAAGRVAMRRGISDSTSLIGFFHSERSIAVAKTAPTSGFPGSFLGAAIEGPSRDGFFFYPVYYFSNGETNFARNSDLPHILPNGASHVWSVDYTPPKDGRPGQLRATLGQKTGVVEVPAIAQEPAEFDRFGIVTTWIDGNSQRVYYDDLTYTFRQQRPNAFRRPLILRQQFFAIHRAHREVDIFVDIIADRIHGAVAQ
jgi:hypothetical protein